MSKIALITGITGQDGSYLAELLLKKNYEVHGLVRTDFSKENKLKNWRIKKIINDIVLHKERGAAEGGSLKMIKLGGVTKAFEAAELSKKLGMKVNLAGKVCETSVSSAAVTHLAAAIPQIEWGLSLTNQYAATDIVKNPMKISNGMITVPEGYGLGIEVDEEAVSRLKK